MKRMRKTWSLLLVLTMLAGVLSACGAKQESAAAPAPETEGPVVVEKLNIAFAPYDASEVIMAATEPLCGMLQEKAFFMVSVSKKWQYCQKNDVKFAGLD